MSVGASPYEPTAEILRISARILLHVASQPRIAPGETAPPSLTQAGMASALGTTQAAVSNALKRLVDGGALQVDRLHVHLARQRLKVYQLTELGERLAAHIRSRLDPSNDDGRRAPPALGRG